jgi:hypothetical protein
MPGERNQGGSLQATTAHHPARRTEFPGDENCR